MKKRIALAGAVASALVLSACGGGGSSGSAAAAGTGASNPGTPVDGGQVTVLEDSGFAGAWPTGLDPATNSTGGANLDMQQAIYGGLFLLEADKDGSNAHIEPNQAESGTTSPDGLTFTMKLRSGITFSDGTPLDAQAVMANWQRDIAAKCTCKPTWQLAASPFTVVDPQTIQIHFAQPTGAVLSNFPVSNFNWIASPAALQKMGEDAFKINPVGAGPFTVASDQLNSSLVLQKNPSYFKKGLPHLDKLTFQSIGGDQPAYQALEAGQAQAYIGMNTTPLIDQAQKSGQMQLTVQPATSPYVIQLNTQIAPFDNPKARQAIYAATDWNAITKGLFGGKYPVSQSFTAPGGLFYHQKVDGYQGYDLELAKKLVQEVGGITINIGTISNYVAEQVNTALQTQWKKAGINVTITNLQLNGLIQQFTGGKWTAMLQTAGAWDPAAGVGVGFRFNSHSPFTGVKDPQLDSLLAQAGAAQDQSQRDQLYQQAAGLIAKNYYAPFGLAFAPVNVAVAGVHGPGLTTKLPSLAVNTIPIWDQVWRQKG